MRIVAIREKTVALSSTVRNASIGFAGMTASALAMVSDVMRDGIPVVGFAFDSVGRYGHGGLLRERFIPRVLAAEPEGYLDEESGGPDPFKIWKIAMRDEKPGGHGERSGAVGLIDAAAWDLAAKLEEKPLWHVLAERFGDGSPAERVPVYASAGHYHAENDVALLVEEVRRCGGIAVPCHPGRTRVGMVAHVHQRGSVEGVEVIEVLNGGSRGTENDEAGHLAEEYGYRGIGGSDAHIVSHIGRCATHFEEPIESIEELVSALQHGGYRALRPA